MLHIASGPAECAGYHRRRHRREHLRELRGRLQHAGLGVPRSLAGAARRRPRSNGRRSAQRRCLRTSEMIGWAPHAKWDRAKWDRAKWDRPKWDRPKWEALPAHERIDRLGAAC